MRWKSFAAMCAAGVATLVGVACGGGEQAEADAPAATPSVVATNTPDALTDSFVLSEEVSAYQQEILEDGTVTFEDARFGRYACSNLHGWRGCPPNRWCWAASS